MSSLKRRKYGHDSPPATAAGGRGRSSYTSYTATVRPMVLLLARTCLLPLASAAPLSNLWSRNNGFSSSAEEPEAADPSNPNLYVYLGVAVALVLLGGAFAGLTIALMGQDETYLQVIATSGEGSERKHAEKVLRLLKRGKHWVLVTLLLSNVITNETLPIVLDRSLGGGWPAVLSSTVLIVIFGEIAPQSVCVRYGLSIGAFCAPFVLALMWIMCPVAWPTAKLLDWLLGEDHGTMYKKAGLKTLVQLHKTLGTAPGERLMEDEVTIINSVLDLKDKPVGDIMTPMQDVFTMSADTVLDEKMMDIILSQGYSRIPIYMPDNSKNFIGMLLVKILITYDPEDAMRVRDFSLATLPETAPFTSCLDIINFFQEGKSHMVLVSDFPGHDRGALGVVTLEDVIEELIGEEIIDESDVFIDVHKAIRRLAPAPKQRLNRAATADERLITTDADVEAKEPTEDEPLLGKDSGSKKPSANGLGTTFLMRRKSSAASDSTKSTMKPSAVQVRTDNTDIRQHLRHLGPSNAANKPRATKYTSVKIKPGIGTIPEDKVTTAPQQAAASSQERPRSAPGTSEEREGDGASAGGRSDVVKSAGRDASDGTTALHAAYGTLDAGAGGYKSSNLASDPMSMSASEASQHAERHTSPPTTAIRPASYQPPPQHSPLTLSEETSRQNNYLRVPDKIVVGDNSNSNSDDGDGEGDDAIADLSAANSIASRSRSRNPRAARSGSITETFVEAGGMNKLVLEMTSSSDEPDDPDSSARVSADGEVDGEEGNGGHDGTGARAAGGAGEGGGGSNGAENGGWLSNAGSGMRKKSKKKGKRKKGTSTGS